MGTQTACARCYKDIGLLVNSSRAVIYASSGEDFAEKAGEEARKVQGEMGEWV